MKMVRVKMKHIVPLLVNMSLGNMLLSSETLVVRNLVSTYISPESDFLGDMGILKIAKDGFEEKKTETIR